MKKCIVFVFSLLFLSGCEIHHAPSGKPVFVMKTEPPVVVMETQEEIIYVQHDYQDYCYELPYDFCCAYYDHYSFGEVCKMTECLDYHTDEWYWQSEECWYE